MLVRYAEAEQVAHELVREAFAEARESTPRGAVVAANPSPFPRDDLIEVDVQVPEEWEAVSLEFADGTRSDRLERNEPQLHHARVRGAEIPSC